METILKLITLKSIMETNQVLPKRLTIFRLRLERENSFL